MNRRFLRSLLSFDPFFNDPFFYPRHFPFRPRHYQIKPTRQVNEAEAVFNNFFKQNGIKESEKEFFEKHYPEKVEKKFDPHSTLGISKDASPEQIREAYRELALKYHPKNDSSVEGEKKFRDLAKAYDILTSQRYQVHQEQNTFNSLFEDFHKKMDELIQPELEKTEKVNKEQSINEKDLNGAELYSQSTYIENINGKKRVNIEKQYKKDGKLLKVKREQNFNADGTKDVTETFDDGAEVKKKTFVENVEHKKITQ